MPIAIFGPAHRGDCISANLAYRLQYTRCNSANKVTSEGPGGKRETCLANGIERTLMVKIRIRAVKRNGPGMCSHLYQIMNSLLLGVVIKYLPTRTLCSFMFRHTASVRSRSTLGYENSPVKNTSQTEERYRAAVYCRSITRR